MSQGGGLAEDDADDNSKGIFRVNKFSRNYHRVDPEAIVRTTELFVEVESMAQANAMQFEKSLNNWNVDWTKEGAITPEHIEVYNDHEGNPAPYIIFNFGKVPMMEGEEKLNDYIDDHHGIRINRDVAAKIWQVWNKSTCPYLKKPGEDDKAPREPRNKYKLVYEALKKCGDTANAKDAGWPVYNGSTNSRRVWPTSQRGTTGTKANGASADGLTHTTEQGEAFALPRGIYKVTQIEYNADEFAVQVLYGKRSIVVCQYKTESQAKRQCLDGADN